MMSNRMKDYTGQPPSDDGQPHPQMETHVFPMSYDPESHERWLVVRTRDCAIYDGNGFVPLSKYRPEFGELELPLTKDRQAEFDPLMSKLGIMEVPRPNKLHPPWSIHALSKRPVGWFASQGMAEAFGMLSKFNDPSATYIITKFGGNIKMRGNTIASADGSQSSFIDNAPAEEITAAMKLRAKMIKKMGAPKETDQFDEYDEKKEE